MAPTAVVSNPREPPVPARAAAEQDALHLRDSLEKASTEAAQGARGWGTYGPGLVASNRLMKSVKSPLNLKT